MAQLFAGQRFVERDATGNIGGGLEDIGAVIGNRIKGEDFADQTRKGRIVNTADALGEYFDEMFPDQQDADQVKKHVNATNPMYDMSNPLSSSALMGRAGFGNFMNT